MHKDEKNKLKVSNGRPDIIPEYGIGGRALSREYGATFDVLPRTVNQSLNESLVNSARAVREQQERMIETLRRPITQSLNESLANSARAVREQQERMIETLRRPITQSLNESLANSARAVREQQDRMIDILRRPVTQSLSNSIINSARAATIQYESILDVLRKPTTQSLNQALVKSLREMGKNDSESSNKPQQPDHDVDTKMSAEILNGISINRVIMDAVQELNKNVSAGAEPDFIEAVSDLVNKLPELSQKVSSNALRDYVSKVPGHAQFILWILISCVIYPYMKAVLDDIAVSLTNDNLKPLIRGYICDQPWATNKIISILICSTPQGNLASNRFVNADYLYVRKTPNQKSDSVDLLPRFEPVTIIKKSENFSWSLIRYKNDDGEMMEGWVFSRYLYKPKQ